MAIKITYTEDQKYGIPQLKKYPMPDKRHVISAIKFFNYVEPKYEKQLAKAILARIKEYGMSFDDFGVGEDNRFSKYLPKQALAHHGILGQKWGVRRYQNEDGSLTSQGKKRYSTKEIIEARKKLGEEKNKLSQLEKRKSDIESETEYRDDIYDLRLNAEDMWDSKNNRMLTDKEWQANWNKYDKAYKKALSENKEYSKILNDIDLQKKTVKELETMSKTKTGKDYTGAVLGALGSITVASAGMLVVDYLMNHR